MLLLEGHTLFSECALGFMVFFKQSEMAPEKTFPGTTEHQGPLQPQMSRFYRSSAVRGKALAPLVTGANSYLQIRTGKMKTSISTRSKGSPCPQPCVLGWH